MTLKEQVTAFLLPHLAENPELSFGEFEELKDSPECSTATFYKARSAALEQMANRSPFDDTSSVEATEGLSDRLAKPVSEILAILNEPGNTVTGIIIRPAGVQVQELTTTSFSLAELSEEASA